MKIKQHWFAGIMSAMLFCSSCTLKSPHDQIDQDMKYFYEKGSFNGAVLVASKGKILYDTAMGYADFISRRKLDTGSVFYLASLSKQFTAMGIMLLENRHRLSYKDPVIKYIPELPEYAKEITIQNLLNHTSGLKDYFESDTLVKPDLTNRQVLNWVEQQKGLEFHPGSKFQYSNTGYLLLSIVIEKLSKKTFPVFMNEMIFAPLQMSNTLVYDSEKPLIRNRAIGFSRDKKTDDYNILTTGDGGIFSTVHDLLKWDQGLYKGTLIHQKELSMAFTRPKLRDGKFSDYGFGWNINGEGKNKVVFHTGELNGYQSYIYRDPVHLNTIILLTNQGKAFEIGPVTEKILKVLDKLK